MSLKLIISLSLIFPAGFAYADGPQNTQELNQRISNILDEKTTVSANKFLNDYQKLGEQEKINQLSQLDQQIADAKKLLENRLGDLEGKSVTENNNTRLIIPTGVLLVGVGAMVGAVHLISRNFILRGYNDLDGRLFQMLCRRYEEKGFSIEEAMTRANNTLEGGSLFKKFGVPVLLIGIGATAFGVSANLPVYLTPDEAQTLLDALSDTHHDLSILIYKKSVLRQIKG